MMSGNGRGRKGGAGAQSEATQAKEGKIPSAPASGAMPSSRVSGKTIKETSGRAPGGSY